MRPIDQLRDIEAVLKSLPPEMQPPKSCKTTAERIDWIARRVRARMKDLEKLIQDEEAENQ